MTAREPLEARVRAVLEEALGDGRLGRVDAAEPLLRSGVVTSIELVSVLVEVERRFGVAIPESAALTTSIATIVRAIESGTVPLRRPEPEPDALLLRLRRAARRPVVFALSLVTCLFASDLAVQKTVAGPLSASYRAFVEEGARLYPYSGAFSQDSFAFAVAHHEIASAPPPLPGEIRVAVLGDSGTIGSFFPASDAIPARLAAALSARGTAARVHNLAWYGRLLPKDLMLLELVWDRPLDFVVFTLSDDHLRRSATTAAIDHYRHVTLNWELFARFEQRIPKEERAPFDEVLGRLRRADLIHAGPLRRFGYESLSLLPYQPFLRYLATVRWLPGLFASPMRDDMTVTGELRAALSDPPPPLPPRLTHADLDRAQIEMLASTIRLLQQRDVCVVLYVEPVGPREQRVDRPFSAAVLARRLARRTGSLLVDESWALGRDDFTDSLAHYTPDANRRIGEALAEAIGGGR